MNLKWPRQLLSSGKILLPALILLGLSGCSSVYKQRAAERDRVAQSSGLYCEFINGDDHNDVDVELTFQMAKKCDTSKHYTMTNYKNATEIFGVIYCCAATKNLKSAASSPAPGAKPSTPANPNAKPGAKEEDDGLE